MGSSGYKKINNSDITSVWTCHYCLIGVKVEPSFYEDNGTPICKCGRDMSYSETQVRTPRVILFVEGGVIHDVMADASVTLRMIDYDVEGADADKTKLIKLPGSVRGEKQVCAITKYDLDGIEDLNPFFKQKAIK